MRIIRKSDDEPTDEKECKVEEVPLDESENDLYDPDVSIVLFIYLQS